MPDEGFPPTFPTPRALDGDCVAARRSLATSSKKKLPNLRKLGNPLGFVAFFNRSPALRALAPLLCVWVRVQLICHARNNM